MDYFVILLCYKKCRLGLVHCKLFTVRYGTVYYALFPLIGGSIVGTICSSAFQWQLKLAPFNYPTIIIRLLALAKSCWFSEIFAESEVHLIKTWDSSMQHAVLNTYSWETVGQWGNLYCNRITGDWKPNWLFLTELYFRLYVTVYNQFIAK